MRPQPEWAEPEQHGRNRRATNTLRKLPSGEPASRSTPAHWNAPPVVNVAAARLLHPADHRHGLKPKDHVATETPPEVQEPPPSTGSHSHLEGHDRDCPQDRLDGQSQVNECGKTYEFGRRHEVDRRGLRRRRWSELLWYPK